MVKNIHKINIFSESKLRVWGSALVCWCYTNNFSFFMFIYHHEITNRAAKHAAFN